MSWEPEYASLSEFKSYIGIDDADTTHDDELTLALVAASRAVDHCANRQFGQVASPEARIYTARYDRWRGQWVIDIDDLMTTTGLTIKFDDDDDQVYDKSIDSYRLQPFNAVTVGTPWTRIVVKSDSTYLPTAAEGAVQVTARFGWSAVPDTIKQATLMQANRFFTRKDAPFGVAGSPDMGSEIRLLSKLDADVAVMIRKYVRQWGAV